MTKDLLTGCAEQLATSPDLVELLLQEHHGEHRIHPERHPGSIRRFAELTAGYAAERPRVRSGG